MTNKRGIHESSKGRVQAINFGQPVTNICAGKAYRHLYFVEYKRKSYKNKCGVTHTEHIARCTTGKGEFFDYNVDVIHPGHLCEQDCRALFEPVWKANFG